MRYLVIVTFFLLPGLLKGQDIKNGLIAYYPFNGNAQDATGNGNNGSVYGATLTTDRFGRTNAAFYFNGTSSYIGLGNLISLADRDFSISFIEKAQSNSDVFMIFFSQGKEKNGEGLGLGWNKNYFRFGFYGWDLDTKANFPIIGNWRHWVVTYEAHSRKRCIYLDGVVVATDSYSSYKGSGNLIIGTTAWLGNNYFKGVIDEVRIYGRPLSENEVGLLYKHESNSNAVVNSGQNPKAEGHSMNKQKSTNGATSVKSSESLSATRNMTSAKSNYDTSRNTNVTLFEVADRITEKIGFANKMGDIVIPLEYDAVREWYEGLCAVKKNSKWGFIDKQNRLVIDYQYKDCYLFSNGLSKVETFDGEKYFINRKGERAFDNIYKFTSIFREGLCLVTDNTGKYGFINKKGELIIPCKYDKARDFSEGLAFVVKDGKYGYIDSKGSIIIPIKYIRGSLNDFALDFSEGLVAIYDGKTDKYGYIDKLGRQVIPSQFESVNSFKNGRALIYIGDKAGFINRSGELVVPAIYDQAEDFNEGMASVKRNRKWGAIDTKGQETVPVDNFIVTRFVNGLARAQLPTDNDFSYIDSKGRKVFDYYATDLYTDVTDLSISGGKYTGKLKNGRPDGYGKISYPDGSWYEGEFKNGSSHGQGTLRQKTGLRYTGRFENGVANGTFKIERWTLMGLTVDEWTAVYDNGKQVSSSQTSTGMTDLMNGNKTGVETSSSRNSSTADRNSSTKANSADKVTQLVVFVMERQSKCADNKAVYEFSFTEDGVESKKRFILTYRDVWWYDFCSGSVLGGYNGHTAVCEGGTIFSAAITYYKKFLKRDAKDFRLVNR